MTKDRSGAAAGAGSIYGLGIFGARVYFFQHAHTFWAFIHPCFQGICWPADGLPRLQSAPRLKPGCMSGPLRERYV